MGCFAHIRRKLVEVMDVAPHTPKKSHLDTAMTYAINNEKYLRYYIEEYTLRCGGFAGVDVGHDADVAGILEKFVGFCHFF